MKKTIVYFEKAGPENTSETLKLAKERADELGIKDIVIASSHGGTALKATEFFDPKENNVVAVTICESFKNLGWTMKPEEREKLESKSILSRDEGRRRDRFDGGRCRLDSGGS